MIRLAIIITGSLTLAGCFGTAPVEPSIPVHVPCKAEEPKQPTFRYQPPYSTTFEGIRDLLGDREVALAYEEQLRLALRSCK